MDAYKIQNNNSIIISDNNTSSTRNDTNIVILPELQWINTIYFIFLVCGSVVNLVHILALIRSKRNGILSLVLQISLVDICLLYVAVNEILVLNRQSWYFPPEFCPFFKGAEVLLNTLTIYLLICYNFQVISLWNLHEMELKKNNRNPLTSCNANSDDSNECLVTKQENRLVTIDYRKRKDDISTIFPTIFIWTVSLSLSVPNFTLSSTLRLKDSYVLCAVVDIYYGQALQYSLLIFKVVLPMLLLFLTFVVLTVKLTQNSKTDIDNIITKKINEIRRLIIFGIIVTALYFLTSFQRHFLHFVHIVSCYLNKNTTNNFKMPPLYNVFLSTTNMMYLAILHYSGTVVRAVLCLLVLPKFPHLVRTKMFPFCKLKE